MPARLTDRIVVTPESTHTEAWRARLADAPTLSPAQAFDLSAGEVLLVAVAHPDDETLAMGASLARLAGAGVQVHVVAMTSGEAALDHVGIQVDGLGARRAGELTAAARALGLATSTVLDLPDGALAGRHPELTIALADALDECSPDRVATLWRDDPHPDHRAVARAALAAAGAAGVDVLELGLWSSHWTDPVTVTAEVVLLDRDDESTAAKAYALACYASQTEPLTPDVTSVLPSSVLTWPHEYLVRS